MIPFTMCTHPGFSLCTTILILLVPCPFIDSLTHRHSLHKLHHSTGKQGHSVLYPIDVCRDHRYWKKLPDPAGVIGYGYNIATGERTHLLLFNTSIYNESECRLVGRRSKNGHWEMYRIPSYVSNYKFLDESKTSKIHYQYSVYNSTLTALLDARDHRSLPFDINESTKYEILYLNNRPVPIRQHNGTKGYYTAIQDMAMNGEQGTKAPVLYTLRASVVTGEFQLKDRDELSWNHLNRIFRKRLRESIVKETFIELFDHAGTHYATRGTFGGLSERWWITRRRPVRKCAQGEDAKILRPELLAACDQSRLAGKGDNPAAHANESSGDNCHLIDDEYERFRASHWIVASGGSPAGTIHQAAFNGLAKDSQLDEWLEGLNDEPSTVLVDLAPICDLLLLIDERPWHTETCRQQLLAYIKHMDPFYAGKEIHRCLSEEVPMKFDSSPRRGHDEGIAGNPSNTAMHRVYCLSSGPFPPEYTCRESTNNGMRSAGRFNCMGVVLLLLVRLYMYATEHL